MIDFLKDWTINLVIFIIVISFLEMILPNGDIRKFVKMTIGLIIILVIINPFIKLMQSDIDIEKEILNNMANQYQHREEDYKGFEDYKDNQIKELYISKIKNEISEEVISKTEYKLSEIYIDIDESKDKGNYGSIEKINMKLISKQEDRKVSIEKERNIKVIEINVNIKDVEENKPKDQISANNKPKDLEVIEKEISKKFEIDKEKLFINLETND